MKTVVCKAIMCSDCQHIFDENFDNLLCIIDNRIKHFSYFSNPSVTYSKQKIESILFESIEGGR